MQENSRTKLVQLLVASALTAESATKGNNSLLVDTEMVEIQRMLTNGALKITDASIYSTKDASNSRLVRMFETSDVEAKGITNMTAGKLQRNQVVLVDRIRIVAATSAAAINGSAAVLGGLSYGSIRDHGGLIAGTITIRQSNKNVSYQVSLRNFDTPGRSDTAPALDYLDAPLLLRSQQLIEANLELGRALPDRQAIRLELLGSQTAAF